jgi:hypothetical protein
MAIQDRDRLNGFREPPTARELLRGSLHSRPGSARSSTPPSDLKAQQRLVEDIFMHATAHSRTCDSISERVQRVLRGRDPESPEGITLDSEQVVELSETLGFLEMAVRDLCAQLAPAAVERAKMLANIDPDPDQQTIFDLEGDRLDAFLRPIFNEAGIAGDLISDAELTAIHR